LNRPRRRLRSASTCGARHAGSRLLSAVVKTGTSDPGTACGTIAGDGSVVNVTVASGQNPCFKFYGHENQRVSALLTAVSPSTFGNSWYLRLLRPNQSELTSAFICCGYTTDFLDAVSLPTDGDYTLVIDPAGTLTGSVSLQLYAINDVTGSIAADGSAVNVALTTPGQRGVLTLTATAGQTLSAKMTALSPTSFPNSWTMTLVGPIGPTATNRGSGNGCCANTVAFMEDVTLQDAGTYQLIVDPASNFIGSVAVRLYTVTHVTGTMPTNGTGVTVSLPTPGANAYLTFTGTQGQHVSFSGANGTIAYQEWGCDVWTSLRDASNTLVPNSSVCMEPYGSGGPLTLPSTGTYTLVVDPTLDAVGNLTLSLTLSP
jgi:hypothetical protein